MKRIFYLIVSGMFLLTGCSARAHELERSAVVRALAFDRAEEGYEISAYIAGAEQGSVITLSAETAAEGFFRLNTETERKIFFEKNQVILISSDIRDIEEILLAAYSSQEAQRDAKIMIVQGKAKEVLSYEGLFRETAEDIEQTLVNAWENANYPLVTLYGAVNSMAAEEGCCLLPMGKMAEENLVLERCMVYRDYRVLQSLDARQILGCALLRQAEKAVFSLGESSYAIGDISVKKTAEAIKIRCTYRLLMGQEKERREIETYLKETAEETCALAQKLGADFTGLHMEGNPSVSVCAEPAANDYSMKGGRGA